MGDKMSTISLRLEDADYKLLQEYISVNQLSLSAFVREAVLEKIEDSLNMDEERILSAYKKSFDEPSIDNTALWDKLGV